MSLKVLVDLWNRFWFTESSPLPVAVFRIAFGLILFTGFLCLIPDFLNFYSDNGWTKAATIARWSGEAGLDLFNIAPQNDSYVIACFAVFIVASITMTIGYKSRLSCIIMYFGLNSLYHRNPFILNSGDCLMRVMIFWMVFAPTGEALSVDSWLKRRKGVAAARNIQDPNGPEFDNYKPVSDWPLRLLQLQVTLVYAHTFYKKFFGPAWYDGYAVYYSSRVEDLVRFPMPFVFDQMWTINFLTWSTLIIEGALFTLIWFKETRYWVIAAAVIFHLAIDYHMNIPFFEYMMIASYLVFIRAEDLAFCLRRLKKVLKIKSAETSIHSSGPHPPDANSPERAT